MQGIVEELMINSCALVSALVSIVEAVDGAHPEILRELNSS